MDKHATTFVPLLYRWLLSHSHVFNVLDRYIPQGSHGRLFARMRVFSSCKGIQGNAYAGSYLRVGACLVGQSRKILQNLSSMAKFSIYDIHSSQFAEYAFLGIFDLGLYGSERAKICNRA